MEIELILSFENDKWVCYKNHIRYEAYSLEDMDKLIKKKLLKEKKKGNYLLKYLFDFKTFPLWMRQYMPHYFNREIIITI